MPHTRDNCNANNRLRACDTWIVHKLKSCCIPINFHTLHSNLRFAIGFNDFFTLKILIVCVKIENNWPIELDVGTKHHLILCINSILSKSFQSIWMYNPAPGQSVQLIYDKLLWRKKIWKMINLPVVGLVISIHLCNLTAHKYVSLAVLNVALWIWTDRLMRLMSFLFNRRLKPSNSFFP